MGFDFNVIIRLDIDSSGVAYAYDNKAYVKIPYYPERIPEKFLCWLNARGSHFHAYIHHLGNGEREVDASYFLHHFPDWQNVVEYLSPDIADLDWTETDHNEFREAIVWFAARPWFNINWFY